MSFKKYLKSKEFTNRSITTRMRVINMYLEWLNKENVEPEHVSYSDLLLFMKHCSRKGTKQRTVQNYLGVIKHYYDYLLNECKVTVNPASGIEIRGVKRKSLYHILEPHELHGLYNKYPSGTLQDRRNKVILGLLVYQGLRSEEAGKLAVDDIKLREGKIDVPGSRKTNGRLLQLESSQIMDMYDYILQVRPQLLQMEPKRKSQEKISTEKLFISEGGHCQSFSNLMTQLMIKVRKINPVVRNAKQVRASVIIKWLRIYNLRETQHLAGHRYISSTEAYQQNDVENLKEEVQQFHPLG